MCSSPALLYKEILHNAKDLNDIFLILCYDENILIFTIVWQEADYEI